MKTNEQEVEQKIKDKFKGNLQIFIAFGTVIGLVVGVINFFILTAITPLEKRVGAIEERNEGADLLIVRFVQLEERDKQLVEDVKEIKEGLKEVGKAHGIIL